MRPNLTRLTCLLAIDAFQALRVGLGRIEA